MISKGHMDHRTQGKTTMQPTDQAADQAAGTSGPATDQATARRQPWTPGQKSKRAKAEKPPTGKRPLKLSVTLEAHEKLALHALKSGQTISEVVESLASDHLNQWVIHAKPGPRG